MTKREKVLARIKKQARKHYKLSIMPEHLDCCTRFATEVLGMSYGHHQNEYIRCVARLRRIDPNFPRS